MYMYMFLHDLCMYVYIYIYICVCKCMYTCVLVFSLLSVGTYTCKGLPRPTHAPLVAQDLRSCDTLAVKVDSHRVPALDMSMSSPEAEPLTRSCDDRQVNLQERPRTDDILPLVSSLADRK